MRPNPHARLKKPFETLRAAALRYPQAWEDFPWGDRTFKVGKKVFAFIDADQTRLGVTFKLPASGDVVLAFPFAEPTGYGLGKAGWVSMRFLASEGVPLPMLLEHLDESYRAIAPKTLLKALDASDAAHEPAKKRTKVVAKKKKKKKKPAARRSPGAGKRGVSRR